MSQLLNQYEDMRIRYRALQKEFKERTREMIELLESYDGSRAVDEWDDNIMPSREWEKKLAEMTKRLKEKK